MARFVDSVIAYRILRMLVTPFNETDAYKQGIIDEKGKELKRMSQLNTVAERDAYTLLHRMVYRIKRIIEKVPTENKKLLSFAAALSLVKEHANANKELINLEELYLDKLNNQDILQEDIDITHNFLSNRYLMPFKVFAEEVPANNASATPGVAGFTPDTMGVSPKKKKKTILKRVEVKNV